MKKIIVDVLKINHWLNARKVTIKYIYKKNRSLSKKLKTNKNFIVNEKELKFLNSQLLIPTEKIQIQNKIPDYIFWSSEKINKTKRSINRDGIHFYNYYSLYNISFSFKILISYSNFLAFLFLLFFLHDLPRV